MLEAAPSRPGLQIDGYLPLSALNLDLVRDLERLAPFGLGNPALALVSSGLSVKSHRPVGRSEEHMLLELEDGDGAVQRAIWWGGAGELLPDGRFDLAYSARASDYRGVPEVQVEWLAARPLEGGPIEVATGAPARFRVVDYRHEPDPRAILEALRAQEEVLVWCEGPEQAIVRGRTRLELAPASALAIWTAPAGRAELLAALERVSPATVYLFALDPGLDTPETFLRRLTGLVKYALNSAGGRAALAAFAAATAQRGTTVRRGLAWLQARGILASVREAGDALQLSATSPPDDREAGQQFSPVSTAAAAASAAQLEALLAETAAYRAFFRQAGKDTLLL
jgi:single-stranded-DNA-specific exonuclease